MEDLFFEGEEKRISRRIRTKFPFRYKVLSGPFSTGDYLGAKTNDISSFGLQFTSKFPLSIGTNLEMELNIPKINHLINVTGRVVRISELLIEKYYVGVLFSKIDKDDQEKLKRQIDLIDVCKLLEMMIERQASDLHLTANKPPYFRINKQLLSSNVEKLCRDDMKRMIFSVMDDHQIEKFEEEKELNFALQLPGLGRFRVNVHLQRGNVEATYRLIQLKIRSLEELGLPDILTDLARSPDGLVIIAGPTGVGKSTTLAAMLELINKEFRKVIVTLEDPIEFVHDSRNCIVKQREIGSDTQSFATALKHVLRQDPDVIFVGEVRDLETMSVALEAAETGHLVLTTLHTSDAAQTVNRVLGIFPHDQRESAAAQLSSSLRGVVCQRLLPRKDNKGLVVATEVLIGTPAVKTVIRDDKIEQIPNQIQTGTTHKMHNMDTSILKLYQEKKISFETAIEAATDKRRLVALASEKEATKPAYQL
jgi:twitching motility protein PilT